jgi:hypothetical protein
MSYQKHNFISKQKLTAQAMNEIESGIVSNESAITEAQGKINIILDSISEQTNKVDIIPLQTLPETTSNAFGEFYGTGIMPSPSVLKLGEKYIVEWDDEIYECIGQDTSAVMDGDDAICIGNGEAFGLEGNSEPFIIAIPNDKSGAMFLSLTDTEPTVHTVRIYRIAKPLPSITANDFGKILQISTEGELETVSVSESSIATYIDNYISNALGGEY